MVKKVLPPLNEQNQIPNISTSGEWKVEDSTFLEKLAKGLKMGGEEVVSASEIVSVPDVWARVLIVRNGLLDNRSSVVNEFQKSSLNNIVVKYIECLVSATYFCDFLVSAWYLGKVV